MTRAWSLSTERRSKGFHAWKNPAFCLEQNDKNQVHSSIGSGQLPVNGAGLSCGLQKWLGLLGEKLRFFFFGREVGMLYNPPKNGGKSIHLWGGGGYITPFYWQDVWGGLSPNGENMEHTVYWQNPYLFLGRRFFFNHVPLDPKTMKSEGFNHYKYGL